MARAPRSSVTKSWFNLIANTTTTTGLRVHARLDTGSYPTGTKISDEAMATINIKAAAFHGEWTYTIMPRSAAGRSNSDLNQTEIIC